MNKIPKIVINFLHQNVATVWKFYLYFCYDNWEFQLNNGAAFTLSKFDYMMTL